MGGITPATPGLAGWIGGLLLVAVGAVWLLVRFSGRRAHREAQAEVGFTPGRVRVPQGYWHPSMGPRREPVTELMARCADRPDATVLIPRQRDGRCG